MFLYRIILFEQHIFRNQNTCRGSYEYCQFFFHVQSKAITWFYGGCTDYTKTLHPHHLSYIFHMAFTEEGLMNVLWEKYCGLLTETLQKPVTVQKS